MKELTTKSHRGFIQALSGLFISKDNPTGLSPREMDILSMLLYVAKGEKKVNQRIKEQISTLTGYNLQVVTNYVKKFRDKGVLSQKNEISPILLQEKITIVNGKFGESNL